MSKQQEPPGYNFVPPPSAPPSYFQAINGVNAAQPLTPQQPILTAQQIVTTIVPLGPHTTHMICPSCGCEINTKTSVSPKASAYLGSLVCCLFGCIFGCCLIPCCMDSCMNVMHKCPNCDTYLGQYRR